jgi:hypothetical protein
MENQPKQPVSVLRFEPGTSKYVTGMAIIEKLTIAQLVKKFLAFYGNRSFITAFTRVRYWSLS